MALRKFTPLIFITIVSSCLGIIICGVSLGTDFWFHSSANNGNSTYAVELRYGLFKGKQLLTTPTSEYDLRLVCSDGLCMFSCGGNGALRELDMDYVRNNGAWGIHICSFGTLPSDGIPPRKEVTDSDFMKFGLWLTTILFIAAAIVFFSLSGVLALYNTIRAPIQPILSTFGLYVWNALAGIFVLLALIMWGVMFGGTLKTNPNISATLNGPYQDDIKGRLGFSFWILILAEILPILNIGLLRYRAWKIVQVEKVHLQTIDAKLTSGDVLLF